MRGAKEMLLPRPGSGSRHDGEELRGLLPCALPNQPPEGLQRRHEGTGATVFEELASLVELLVVTIWKEPA